MSIRSNYGIIGHLSLLVNPVMRLSPHDYRICMEDLLRIRERLAEDGHWFREEMMGYLLLAHILDLYDIHAKSRTGHNLSERNGDLLRRFIELLYHKEYIKDRSLSHYASKLCITPHYLTEVCKKASGKPATYWIDRFTTHEIARLLRQKEIPLKDVADTCKNRWGCRRRNTGTGPLGSFMSSFYACLLKICYLCRVFRVKNDEK